LARPNPNSGADAELLYVSQHRKMLSAHLDGGLPVREALRRFPVDPVDQDRPFEAHSGPTSSGTHEAHVVLPQNMSQIMHPLAALGDVSLVVDEADRMRRKLVAECRARGRSWAEIAAALGVSRQAAWQKFAAADE
jgi:hypothetical protein